MKSAHLINLVKIALVALLMWWVFSGIQWGDVVELPRAPEADSAVERVPGTIVAGEDWRADTVRFVPSAGPSAGEEIVVARESAPPETPGMRGDVVPGFLTYWRNLDLSLFAIGALLFAITANLAATRWWWLLRINDLRIGMLEAWRLTWIGVFFNSVVPGQTGGDLIKAIYVVRRCPGARAEAVVSVLVDRILGLASLALLGAVVVLFALDEYWQLAIGIWGILAAVSLGAAIAFSRRARRAIGLDRLLQRLSGKLGATLKKIDAAVFHYRGHASGVALWLVVGIANHALSVTSWMFVGWALGVELPAMQYFVLIPVINIVSAIPIGPNGWGVGEFAFSKLFGDWGAANLAAAGGRRLMATQGVALSVLYRIHLTLWSLVGGLLLLFDPHRVTRRELEDELAREEAEASAAS